MAWYFGAGCLDLPLVQHARSLRAFLRQAPSSLHVKYRDHASLAERICRMLQHQLATGLPSLTQVARQLEPTPQTLRRRLAARGRSPRSPRDRGRPAPRLGRGIPRAQRDGAAEIAGLLGFSEASAFHRAFKHWAGMPRGG